MYKKCKHLYSENERNDDMQLLDVDYQGNNALFDIFIESYNSSVLVFLF